MNLPLAKQSVTHVRSAHCRRVQVLIHRYDTYALRLRSLQTRFPKISSCLEGSTYFDSYLIRWANLSPKSKPTDDRFGRFCRARQCVRHIYLGRPRYSICNNRPHSQCRDATYNNNICYCLTHLTIPAVFNRCRPTCHGRWLAINARGWAEAWCSEHLTIVRT